MSQNIFDKQKKNLIPVSGLYAQPTACPPMTGASTSKDGKGGLVPQPTKGSNTKFLRGDGTWQDCNYIQYFENRSQLNAAIAAGTIGEDDIFVIKNP